MSYGIVDCDIHPTVPSLHTVLGAYLPSSQVKRLEWLGLRPGATTYGRPVGRAHHFVDEPHPEYRPPSGGPLASDLDFVRTTYLEPQNVEAGFINSLETAAVDAWTYPEEAAWFVSAMNDYFLQEWVGEESRLRLNMVVSPLAVDLAVQEIHRIGAQSGVSAIWLPMTDTLFGNRKFFPIWEAACEYDLPIMVHPLAADDFVGTAVRAGGAANSWAERYTGLTEFAMSHLTSMIFEGVFERYPSLRFVSVEYGWSWVPSWLWRADATWKAARRYHPFMRKSPSEYVASNIRFTTQPSQDIPNEWMATMLKQVRAEETLLYASDYPHWDSEEPWSSLRTLEEGTRRKIFRDNAMAFFGSRLQLPEPVGS
ncbi:amidohydrolase family protein [Pseudonocardia alni]|uniref:amidohydrolase family protein n=1 Tax=Pseudonocardia alni TaxID=33907 RepID=UPI003322035C